MPLARRAIDEWRPAIVFNLLEEFHGNSLYDQHVISYLELLQQPYTGCDPKGLTLTADKSLTKKILAYHRIRSPRFKVFPRGRAVRVPRRLRYPIIVKSLVEEGSYGLSQASIVHNEGKLRERVEYLHEKLETQVIAEEYIAGRELYVGVLGNQRLRTLPAVELVFEKLAPGAEPIATSRVKWDEKYQKEHGIRWMVTEDLTDDDRRRIDRVGKRVYRRLGLSGCARIDLRMAEDGEIWIIEANPNPDLAKAAEFSLAAQAAGMEYHALLRKLINLGLRHART